MSPVSTANESASKSVRPAKDMSFSLPVGSLHSTRCSAAVAASTPARRRVDLPAPAFPPIANADGVLGAAVAKWRTRAHSLGRTRSAATQTTKPSQNTSR